MIMRINSNYDGREIELEYPDELAATVEVIVAEASDDEEITAWNNTHRRLKAVGCYEVDDD